VPDRPSAPFVVVGAGLAGAKTVEALRAAGFDGRLLLLGEEPHRPYERPPLSKDYLTGHADREKVYVHTGDWYDCHDVELALDTAVTRIDTGSHKVVTAAGKHIAFAKLLLATGASPRRLRLPHTPKVGADRILYLRTLDDADRLAPWLRPGSGSLSSEAAGSASRRPPPLAPPARRSPCSRPPPCH
jgi:3-phenylpropionate/trans-cinnamate dioxygenase ferredoxin reductase subunit